MQRWSFPSFRLSTPNGNNSSLTLSAITPISSRFPSPMTPQSTGNQTYNPSAKYSHIERILRSRITKKKAKNDQTRKNIANLEAKSAYLRRLKQLEKEMQQLEKEGMELARREKEVRRVVERETTELEANEGEGDVTMAVDGEEQDKDRDWEAEMEERRDYEKAIREDIEAKVRLAGEMAAEIEKEMREGREARYREAERVKESLREGRERLLKREGQSEQNAERELVKRALTIKREDQVVDQKGHQDNRRMKQEAEVEIKNEPIEEIGLLNGAAAWSG